MVFLFNYCHMTFIVCQNGIIKYFINLFRFQSKSISIIKRLYYFELSKPRLNNINFLTKYVYRKHCAIYTYFFMMYDIIEQMGLEYSYFKEALSYQIIMHFIHCI